MRQLGRFLSPGGFVAIVLIAASGCGLSDYQAQMDAQRKRVQEFDEANRLLDEPIDYPKIEYKDPKDGVDRKKDAWEFEIFLRLPKGYWLRSDTPYNYPFPFYRFTGGSEGATNIFVAAASVNDGKKEDVWGRYTRVNFRYLCKVALEDFYLKTHKVSLRFPDKVEPRTRDAKITTAYPDPASTKITFTALAYTDEMNKLTQDHSVFEVYFREESGKQICIVVQRPLRPANVDLLNRAIEASLGSLDLTTAATAKRYVYKKAKGI